MKYLFLVILAVLVAASLGTTLSLPDARSEVPVIYWVTDPNPAREEQIRLFHEWLIENGHVTEDGQPICQLRLDTANRDVTKQIIQGVSGVAGDIFDVGSGAGLQQLHSIGLLRDVTEAAHRLGFDPSYTYPAIESEITLDGRQYMFPCNVATSQLWVNKETFERFNQPLPPKRWTFDEFEELGRAFVEAANKDLPHQQYFYAGAMDRVVMYRSLGLDMFNETLTACALDDPRYAQTLDRLYKWTYVDHIIPTAAELASFSTDSGYGGAQAQLFATGNVAMMLSGRYMLIQFREFSRLRIEQGRPPLALTVSEFPHGGFPNSIIATRAAAIYAGSDHPELAELFLAYLASESYNMQIVRDADALPPNPIYTRNEEYLRPAEWPNEWGTHEHFANAAQTIAIGSSNSPFILTATARRLEKDAYDAFMNGLIDAEAAGEMAAKNINMEIRRTLIENPKLQDDFDQARAIQEKIDAYRAQGKPVPLEWLKNPFHRRYYQEMGWTE
jgi:multiple sugar transport system substrate-binding protein